MGYVIAVIWVIIVVKSILKAMRNNNGNAPDPFPAQERGRSVTVIYHGRTLELPSFVGKQNQFLIRHLTNEYCTMLDFYATNFMRGVSREYVLPLQEHRRLMVGGITDAQIAELRDDAMTTVMELIADDAFDDVESTESASVPSAADKPKDPYAGESYAAPIPPPYESAMAGAEMPSEVHADSHVAPVNVMDGLPKHGPSKVAKHVDEHIATTAAEKTPMTISRPAIRKSPFASLIPHGEKEMRRAMVLKEIIDTPKGLR